LAEEKLRPLTCLGALSRKRQGVLVFFEAISGQNIIGERNSRRDSNRWSRWRTLPFPMPQLRYYSPRLDRDLISSLYHAAKARRLPMTKLTSALVREGLARLSADNEMQSPILREEPPATDPPGRAI
jgi:hypothetical protein